MFAPEEAIGDGPFIYVAIPSDHTDLVPVNATRLLEEWEAGLDPLARLREIANERLGEFETWHWGSWFVEPSRHALDLARRAAEDDEILDRLDSTRAVIADADDVGIEVQPPELIVGEN